MRTHAVELVTEEPVEFNGITVAVSPDEIVYREQLLRVHLRDEGRIDVFQDSDLIDNNRLRWKMPTLRREARTQPVLFKKRIIDYLLTRRADSTPIYFRSNVLTLGDWSIERAITAIGAGYWLHNNAHPDASFRSLSFQTGFNNASPRVYTNGAVPAAILDEILRRVNPYAGRLIENSASREFHTTYTTTTLGVKVTIDLPVRQAVMGIRDLAEVRDSVGISASDYELPTHSLAAP